jgi:hypothetical protein
MTTIRLDELIPENVKFEFVVLDVQGAELEVLKSLGKRIANVNWILTEVSKLPLYYDAATYDEISKFLNDLGFKSRFEAWDRNSGWGDVLYIRESMWSNTMKTLLGRTVSRIYYLFYWNIPQFMFPTLVKIKRILRTMMMKK